LTLRSDITLGDVLRRARLRREESLATTSRATGIAARYLEALEMDAPLEAFPGPVYARMFLRTYARHLGLDQARMLHEFDERFGGTADLTAEDMPRKFAVVGQEARRPSAIARLRRRIEPPKPIAFVPDRTHRRRDGKGSPLMFGALIAAMLLVATGIAVFRQRSAPNPAVAAGAAGLVAQPTLQLPRGGRTFFPHFRLVAYYGAPGTTTLGVLGEGPKEAGDQLLDRIKEWAQEGGRPVLPAFEIIATIATGSPQDDGMYRRRFPRSQIMPFIDEAESIKAYTVLDVQPGRADFMPEVEAYGDLLTRPDIGLALDPEWHVGANEIPGKTIGSVDASTVNQVIAYLSDIVKRNHLPQKLLVVHQFTPNMIVDRTLIKPTPQVAIVFDLDGFGLPQAKVQKYSSLADDPAFHYGFKLFFKQDVGGLMAPLTVLSLAPAPDLVVYQ
jgi:hypothetical protein